jgi:hypothetical protein
MIALATFTDERMTISAERLKNSAVKHGCDYGVIYTQSDIPQLHKDLAAECYNEEKGAGLYVWKPYVCWDAISKLQDGDILIYADAGQEFVNDVNHIINAMDEDIFFFSNGWNHVDWCKFDVMKAINMNHIIGDASGLVGYKDLKQVQASLIFFKVNQTTRDFIKEWMLWSLMPGFCDNSPSKLPNVPTFQETRWDQSILCCLQIKYGYKLHWFPTTTAHHLHPDYPNDKYPAIVNHHRKRNNEY